MGHGASVWRWRKVSVLHSLEGGAEKQCPGAVYSYAYRVFPPGSSFYERCVSLAWCPACRRYTGAVVRVPRGTALPDPLAGLSDAERAGLTRSEHRLLDHLDRLVRHGRWPATQA
jgi:hypothetical protein